MRNVILDVVRKILQTYYTEKSYSMYSLLLQQNKVIASEILQNDVK